ncbi:MAG TPA: RidA family protein [Burkholderiales bacterium]|nr:RidA family protein [Burkholderiales bacterium]
MMHDDAQRRQEYRVESLHEPVSHYTDAVRWGDLLFVSGVAPLDKDLRLVSEDVVEQARKVFLNLKEVLDAAGASFADVLKVTVFLTDVRDRARINPVRKEFFGAARPASSLIGVKELVVPGMKIEIEAIVGLRKR